MIAMDKEAILCPLVPEFVLDLLREGFSKNIRWRSRVNSVGQLKGWCGAFLLAHTVLITATGL